MDSAKADTGRNERQRLVDAVERLTPQWRELALRVHAKPELGFEEHQACAWLSDELEQAGFVVERDVAAMPTAFAAAFGATDGEPVIAFLAEYDALPDTGHSCGHNLSGVASCLAAHALSQVAVENGVRLRVLGSPGEEAHLGGKVKMVEHGLFKDVDFAMMAHAGYMNLPSRDMLCRRNVTVGFRMGKEAGPTDSVSLTRALDAMLLTFRELEQMRSELRPRARVDGVIAEGGDVDDGRILCNCTRAVFILRATTTSYVENLEAQLIRAASAAAEATGTELEWTGEWGKYLPMKRNAAMESAYAESLAFIGEEVGSFPDDWAIGYTDFGNVSHVVPGIHAYFKAAKPGIEHHTPAFTEASCSELGLSGMVVAAKAMALTAFALTTNAGLREQIGSEFGAS